LPITGPDIARSRNGTVLDVERIDVDAQPFRRLLKKDPANFRTDMAQRAARLLDGEAARRDALVGANGGRCADHLHPRQIDIELVSGDLRQRRHNALSDLHLSWRDRDLSRA